MESSRTPIEPGEEAALNHLEQYIDADEEKESLSREDAVTHLLEQGVERPDARAHIEQLLRKGYLYEVNEELRIPPRDW